MLNLLNMSALFVLVLHLLVARVSAAVATASSFPSPCLSDAKPASERSNLWLLDGAGLPLGIVVPDWASARMGSYILKILAEEVLGYNTAFTCAAPTTPYGYFCVANCQNPGDSDNPGCSASQVSHSNTNHLSWELWDGSWRSTIDPVAVELGSRAPELIGTTGFISIDGIWIKDSNAQAIYNSAGLLVEYFRTWQLPTFNSAQYFTPISGIQETLLEPCNQTALYTTNAIQKYRDLTGDTDGVETTSSGLVAKCWNNQFAPVGANGRFWLSPACRQNTTKCVLFITAESWYVDTAMFQATVNQIPLAIAVATNKTTWEQIGRSYNTLMYWFEPDMTFLDQAPHLLRFPPHDSAAWTRGDKSTEARPASISKFVHPDLKDESQIYAFFRNMQLTQTEIDAIMNQTLIGTAQGVSEPQVACNWLKSNRPVWTPWIPDATVCALGYGVVDANGDFVNNKSLATTCDACTAGRFSQITEDAITHMCVACAAGRSSATRATICNEALVEETGISAIVIILIIGGVMLLCSFVLCCFGGYFRKHIKILKGHVASLEQEVKDLQDSAVNMRVVKTNYYPRIGADDLPLLSKKRVSDEKRAMWYWKEDEGRMSAHSPTLTLAPHWVQYAGSVAIELEEAYQAYTKGEGPEELHTDLADRISSTGTESKAHGSKSGTKFKVNFREMCQINVSTGYKRPCLRHLVAKETSAPESTRGDIEQGRTEQKTLLSSDVPMPAELKDETLLVLTVGSIVQLSKQRPDGWAFGNVLLAEGDEVSKVEGISCDAGWFPMNCVDMVGKDDLERLAKMMGPAGADTLAPPPVWAQMKDPSVAEMVLVTDASEKQRVVDWFGKTLMGKCPVVKVERIQNLSLWQSFAVKRQTIKTREGSGAASDCERVWLFHGTNADTVPKIVQQGFNRSFCGKNATMYGKGVYFARDAAYSARNTYSAPDSSGVQRMFLCRVVVGSYCKGIKDALAPDARDKGGTLLHDTTVDAVKDPSIFVTYHDAQAYPDYLVYFKTTA